MLAGLGLILRAGAGDLLIGGDPTSGQRSYSNFSHEVFGGTKLQGKG